MSFNHPDPLNEDRRTAMQAKAREFRAVIRQLLSDEPVDRLPSDPDFIGFLRAKLQADQIEIERGTRYKMVVDTLKEVFGGR